MLVKLLWTIPCLGHVLARVQLLACSLPPTFQLMGTLLLKAVFLPSQGNTKCSALPSPHISISRCEVSLKDTFACASSNRQTQHVFCPTSLSVEDDERFSVESLALPGSSALAFFLCPHKTAAEITPTALLPHAIFHPPCSTVQSTEIFGSCNDGILQKADQRHSLQSGASAPTKPLSSAPPHVVLAPCAAILKPCQMQLLPCRLGTVASFAFSPAEGRLGKRRHTA